MHRKIKVLFLIVTLASLSILLLPTTISTAATPTASAGSSAGTNGDTSVTYKFYDLFNGKMDPEVWGISPDYGGTAWVGRWWAYGMDYVQSWTYPVVYQRGTPAWNEPYVPYDDTAYWTSGRLNVNATKLPLNIDTVAWVDTWDAVGTGHRSFVPWNLTLGAIGSELTSGGYCNVSWYAQFTNESRTDYWGWGIHRHPSGYPNGVDDGWCMELKGTLTLDKLGAMKVFGMNGTTYDNLDTMAGAWANQTKPATAWYKWLDSEGNWWPMILPYYPSWLLVEDVILGNEIWNKTISGTGIDLEGKTTPPDWPWNLPGVTGIFDLSQWPAKVTVPMWVVGWGLCGMIARWLSDWWSCEGGFMPYEGYYSDIHLNASIGPSSTNLLLDTQVDWLLVAADGYGTPLSSPQWVFEPLWGDIPLYTRKEHNVASEDIDYWWSSGWHYYKNATDWIKTYFTSSVGAASYGGYIPYGYTPSSWSLGIDGTASAAWRPWNDPYEQRYYYGVGPGNHSGWDESLIFDWSDIQGKGNVVGFYQQPWTIEPSYSVGEKWGDLYLNRILSEPLINSTGQVLITPTTLTFKGPIDFAEWSYNTYRSSWTRLATNEAWPDCPNGVQPWGEPLIYFGVICPHDVAVHNVKSSKAFVYQHFTMNINVTVKNIGENTETFNVTVYANTTIIYTLSTNTTLTSGTSTTIPFTWNPAGVPGGNYILSAYAKPVSGETDTADNTYTGGLVDIRPWGMVVPKSPTHTKVTLEDFGKLKLIYSKVYPYMNPPYDVNNPETYYYLNSVITGKPEHLMPDIDGNGKVQFADVGKEKLIYSGFPPP